MPAADPQRRRNATAALRAAVQNRAHNAQAYLQIDGTGVCRINTGRMADRSRREIFNYAYLVNGYIARQRGRKVKIKRTQQQRAAQARFCTTVRGANRQLFTQLNNGKRANHAMFSVVAHLPDECIQVRRFGESHNQLAPTGTGGIGIAPGWMPMTNQANGLVAKIGNQTLNSTGQTDGPYLAQIVVDGIVPDVMLDVPVLTGLLGNDPYDHT